MKPQISSINSGLLPTTTKKKRCSFLWQFIYFDLILDIWNSAWNIQDSIHNVIYLQVLRDSGHAVNLVVKRRVVLPSAPEPQTVKVSLYKNKKKEDFGIVLGCKIYIKEITNRSVADKDGNLQDGDIVQRINNISLDGLSFKEARKLLDAAKDRLGRNIILIVSLNS